MYRIPGIVSAIEKYRNSIDPLTSKERLKIGNEIFNFRCYGKLRENITSFNDADNMYLMDPYYIEDGNDTRHDEFVRGVYNTTPAKSAGKLNGQDYKSDAGYYDCEALEEVVVKRKKKVSDKDGGKDDNSRGNEPRQSSITAFLEKVADKIFNTSAVSIDDGGFNKLMNKEPVGHKVEYKKKMDRKIAKKYRNINSDVSSSDRCIRYADSSRLNSVTLY